jgi:2-polyprenyl-3-methyl-5-hydroxy-6-metoxy-1,4-benzoquinol methylase
MDKQKLYDEIAARKYKPKDLEPYTGGNGRVDRCVELFNRGVLKSGGTLLDVGGGIGDLGYALRDRFERRITLDISENNLRAAEEKGNESICCDVDANGFGRGIYLRKGQMVSQFVRDGEVDVVTALDFIEHIIDPENFARECFRVLKPVGQVFINTPNIQYWNHQEQLAITGRFPHTSGDREVYHGGHLAFFTYLDLVEIFQGAGFVGFEQIKDEEGYSDPHSIWKELYQKGNRVVSSKDYIDMCLRLGCPNLLFKCVKP